MRFGTAFALGLGIAFDPVVIHMDVEAHHIQLLESWNVYFHD